MKTEDIHLRFLTRPLGNDRFPFTVHLQHQPCCGRLVVAEQLAEHEYDVRHKRHWIVPDDYAPGPIPLGPLVGVRPVRVLRRDSRRCHARSVARGRAFGSPFAGLFGRVRHLRRGGRSRRGSRVPSGTLRVQRAGGLAADPEERPRPVDLGVGESVVPPEDEDLSGKGEREQAVVTGGRMVG